MNDGVILLAEDRPERADLFVRILRMGGITNEVIVARDDVETLDYLFADGEHAGRDDRLMPRLAILDLNIPRAGALETLRRLRADERTALLPIVVFSASGEERDMLEAYRLGANAYVDKRSSVPFPEMVRRTARFWLTVNQLPPVLVSPTPR
ncbi:MAG TPA: response regulator [Rubrobacteraceae bacterium]|nr:response regulator [Rubrobacteraceae bacterium]